MAILAVCSILGSCKCESEMQIELVVECVSRDELAPASDGVSARFSLHCILRSGRPRDRRSVCDTGAKKRADVCKQICLF